MIFQEPMSSLNPLHDIEKQISEVIQLHRGLSRKAARAETCALLERVGIPDPEAGFRLCRMNYPAVSASG